MEDIAAVVLNYMNYHDTIKCVDNILSKSNARVVIVDNNSPNESIYVLQKKYDYNNRCDIVKNSKNAGYAAGNNVGFRYISQNYPSVRYICIMNPDTLFEDPELLPKMKNALCKKSSYAAVAPVMIQHGCEEFRQTCWNYPKGYELAFNQLMFYHPKRRNCEKKNAVDGILEVDVVHGSFFMLKMEALESIGYMDEHTFMYSEECLLSLDLKKAGYQEIVLVDSNYYHNHPELDRTRVITLGQRIIKAVKGAMNSRIHICKKHYGNVYLPLIYTTSGLNILYLCLLHAGYRIKRVIQGTGYKR